jgi:hypothetical protein
MGFQWNPTPLQISGDSPKPEPIQVRLDSRMRLRGRGPKELVEREEIASLQFRRAVSTETAMTRQERRPSPSVVSNGSTLFADS